MRVPEVNLLVAGTGGPNAGTGRLFNAKNATVILLTRAERRFGFAVIAAETEFREERDSRRSQSSGVTPACRGLLPPAGSEHDDASEKLLAKQP